jgi:hypothetical protein
MDFDCDSDNCKCSFQIKVVIKIDIKFRLKTFHINAVLFVRCFGDLFFTTVWYLVFMMLSVWSLGQSKSSMIFPISDS